MAKAEEKRRGRPPAGDKGLVEALTIRFPTPMMERIEAVRDGRLDQPDKGALIRELVAIGLEVVETKKGGKR